MQCFGNAQRLRNSRCMVNIVLSLQSGRPEEQQDARAICVLIRMRVQIRSTLRAQANVYLWYKDYAKETYIVRLTIIPLRTDCNTGTTGVENKWRQRIHGTRAKDHVARKQKRGSGLEKNTKGTQMGMKVLTNRGNILVRRTPSTVQISLRA